MTGGIGTSGVVGCSPLSSSSGFVSLPPVDATFDCGEVKPVIQLLTAYACPLATVILCVASSTEVTSVLPPFVTL
ncbi:hypothetical protein LSPH24S_02201 [Lysinibacillus sphaericus]